MAIKIGQASLDEHGKIVGGAAGNQSGRELNIQSWYANGWTMVLRPIDVGAAERMAAACEAAVRNQNIGYDQSQRNTLRAAAKAAGFDLGRITTPCETDCSAFMAVCAEASGIKMDVAYINGNTPATYQMRAQWAKTGQFVVLTERKYLDSDKYLRRGDVLVNESRHTAMALEGGALAHEKNSEIIINGRSYPIDRQLIGGRNYFQIRELVDVFEKARVCKLDVDSKGSIAVLTQRR